MQIIFGIVATHDLEQMGGHFLRCNKDFVGHKGEVFDIVYIVPMFLLIPSFKKSEEKNGFLVILDSMGVEKLQEYWQRLGIVVEID